MNHDDIRHRLSEYIDNELTPDERAVIDEHLAACASCSDALRELRKTIDQMKEVEEVDSPAWMTQKIMAKVREDSSRNTLFRKFFYPLAVKLPLQAVALLFLAVTAYYIYTGVNPAARYAEPQKIAAQKSEAPAQQPLTDAVKKKEAVSTPGPAVRQEPGYKSLDMRPANAPAPTAAPAGNSVPLASAPAPATSREAAGAQPQPSEKRAFAAKAAPLRQAASAEATTASDGDKIGKVTHYFEHHDLPEIMQVKGLSFSTLEINEPLADLDWLKTTRAYTKPCPERYLVNVELAGRSLKYLYCYEPSAIRLFGIFELKNATWYETK